MDDAKGKRLVGREKELGLFERLLGGLMGAPAQPARGARFVQLVGEPGIGKTRLLVELASTADARGCLVLEGRAAQFEEDLPFGVFVDALDDYLGGLNRRRLQSLGKERLSELAAVFPTLSGAGTSAPAERFRLHYAVRALLGDLAAERPLVLALDDLHWADPGSVELACHLLRRPPRAPVLVALSHRAGQEPDVLAAGLAKAQGEGLAERCEVAPLTREQADELLGAELDAGLRSRLHAESGGNPFYLEQLARTGGRPVGEGPAGLEVPAAVSAAVAEELRRAPAGARLVLDGAAVTGERFEIDLAARAADVDSDDVPARIDELIDLDLIRPTNVPRHFRFRHPIVHRAVYDETRQGWRLAAHRRVAGALAESGARAELRAHHVERSAAPGDVDAATVLSAAAREVAARAPATAAIWLRSALRILPHGNDHFGERLLLLGDLARAEGSAGRIAEACATTREVLDALPPELDRLRPDLIVWLAGLEHLRGEHRRARTLVRTALDQLGDRESKAAAQLQLQAASDEFFEGDFDRMREWSASALSAARGAGSDTLLLSTVAHLGLADYHLGRISACRAGVEEARELSRRITDARLAPRVWALLSLAWSEYGIERYEDGIATAERALRIARERGQGHMLVPFLVCQAWIRCEQGRPADAAAAAEAAVEAAILTNSDEFRAWALAIQCWAAVLAGDLDAALAHGEEAIERARRHARVFGPIAALQLGEARVEAGDAQRGRDELLDAAGGAELPLLEPPIRPRAYEVLARAELALGATEAAAGHAERAARLAGSLGLPVKGAGYARRAAAAVQLARGEAAAAAESALLCARGFRDGGAALEAGRAGIVAGRALAAAGERAAAIEALETALAALDARGGRRFAEEAARELRTLGRAAGRIGRRTGEILTDRELEIARLVTQGKTNREIAGTLFLSEKTVETHLSKVFRKLGVSRRAAVAQAMTRDFPDGEARA